jgi:hypothetical protein
MLNAILTFLRLVLPSEGLVCIVLIREKRAKQFFFPSREEAALFVSQQSGGQSDIYFACATYVEIGSRKRNNICKIQSLFLDLDTNEGASLRADGKTDPKPNTYRDRIEAIQALTQFCQQMSLPVPTIVVGSGYGLHVYWVLDTPLDADRWQVYADGLKGAAVRLGLLADPSRTADACSILRPVGTVNHKYTTLPLVQ